MVDRCFRCSGYARRVVMRVRDDAMLYVCGSDRCEWEAHVRLGGAVERELECSCAADPLCCGVHGLLATLGR